MSLRAKLAAMMELRPARYRSLLDDLSRNLSSAAVEQALKVGDRAPEFVLPDSRDQLISSLDLLARGPLVVVFFRGEWCPFCRETLAQLDAIASGIHAAGGQIVALTPDTGEYLEAMKKTLAPRFPLLNDVDGAVGLAYGVNYLTPSELAAYWRTTGTDLAKRHGNGFGMLPMAATFVIDRHGLLRIAHVSPDITDWIEPRELLQDVVRLCEGSE